MVASSAAEAIPAGLHSSQAGQAGNLRTVGRLAVERCHRRATRQPMIHLRGLVRSTCRRPCGSCDAARCDVQRPAIPRTSPVAKGSCTDRGMAGERHTAGCRRRERPGRHGRRRSAAACSATNPRPGLPVPGRLPMSVAARRVPPEGRRPGWRPGGAALCRRPFAASAAASRPGGWCCRPLRLVRCSP